MTSAAEQEQYALQGPLIQEHLLHGCPKKAKRQEAMNRDVQMMADFDVADVVPTSALTEDQITNTLNFTGVHRWKVIDIRSRLCVRGFKEWIKNLDDIFASTPVTRTF